MMEGAYPLIPLILFGKQIPLRGDGGNPPIH